jgi:hypothetical protein
MLSEIGRPWPPDFVCASVAMISFGFAQVPDSVDKLSRRSWVTLGTLLIG